MLLLTCPVQHRIGDPISDHLVADVYPRAAGGAILVLGWAPRHRGQMKKKKNDEEACRIVDHWRRNNSRDDTFAMGTEVPSTSG